MTPHFLSLCSHRMPQPVGARALHPYPFQIWLPPPRGSHLGVIFENDLRMDTYIQNICRSASYALYKRSYKKLSRWRIHRNPHSCFYHMSYWSMQQPFVPGLPDSHIPENTKPCRHSCNSHTFSWPYRSCTSKKLHWLSVRYPISCTKFWFLLTNVFMDWHHYIYKNSYRNINLLVSSIIV